MRRAAALALLFACKRSADRAPPPPAPVAPAQIREQEPNDFHHAQQIPATAVVSGELSAPADEDWFRVAPDAPSALRIELKPSGSAELEVSDRDRRRILSVKAGGDEFGIVPAVGCAEACFLKVSGRGPQTYTLSVTGATPDPARELEPDDDAAHAIELESGRAIEGTFYAPHDQDWYRIAVADAGLMLRVETLPVGGVREELEVRSASDGGVVGVFPTGSIRALRVDEPPGGGYFLALRGTSKHGAPLTPYSITATLLAAPEDLEIEPNNDPAHATPFHGSATGYLSPPGDVDFFRLQGDGGILRAAVSGPDGGVELALVEADGGVVSRADLALPSVGLPEGDSYLRVRGEFDDAYRLTAEIVADDGAFEREPNDSLATAQLLVVPAQVKGWVWPARDVDLFRFHVPAGHAPISIVLSHPREMDLQLLLREVHGDGGDVIGSSHSAQGDGEEKLLSVPLKEGDYAVEIRSPRKDASRTDFYTLSVR